MQKILQTIITDCGRVYKLDEAIQKYLKSVTTRRFLDLNTNGKSEISLGYLNSKILSFASLSPQVMCSGQFKMGLVALRCTFLISS